MSRLISTVKINAMLMSRLCNSRDYARVEINARVEIIANIEINVMLVSRSVEWYRPVALIYN